MGKKEAHPGHEGIVPNKEGTGAVEIHHKVGSVSFILVVTEESKGQILAYRSGRGDGDGLVPCEGFHSFEALKDAVEKRPFGFAASDDIFADKLGMRASNKELENAYGTTDKAKIATQILVEGSFS